MQFVKKPVVIEAITFEEFIEYGKIYAENLVDGMPWHFHYMGHPVTHETDTCYIIPTLEGDMQFTPEDVLITGVRGEIYPCKKDIFEETYEPVKTSGMTFKEAFMRMKEGYQVKLPSWGGYWCWDEEKQTIMIHCRPQDSDTQGEVLDIRETQRVEYTLSNIMCDDWVLATEENCPVLGGVNTFSFSEALKYLKRGFKVARKNWNGKNQYVFLAKDLEFMTEADLSDLNPNGVEECTEENMVYVYDCLAIRTADRKIQLGWLATQSDLLAEDWMFAE